MKTGESVWVYLPKRSTVQALPCGTILTADLTNISATKINNRYGMDVTIGVIIASIMRIS